MTVLPRAARSPLRCGTNGGSQGKSSAKLPWQTASVTLMPLLATAASTTTTRTTTTIEFALPTVQLALVSMPALEQRLQVRAMLGSRARKPGAWRTLMPDAHGSSGRGGGSSDRQKLTVVASGDGVGVPFSPLRAQHSRPTAAAAPVLTSTRQPEEGLRLGSRRSSSSSSVENGSRSLHRVSMNALEGSGNGSSSAIARRSQRSFSSSDGNESDDQMSVDGRSFEGKPRQNSEALT